MQALRKIEEAFERELASRTDLSLADKNAARVQFARRMQEERNSRVDEVVATERAAQSGNPLRAAAGTIGAATLNFADSATLNFLPRIVGVGNPERRERVETALSTSKQTNPIAATAGQIFGFFGATPASAVAKAGEKIGGGLVRGLAPRAFDEIALKPFMQRAALRFAQGLGSGTASVATTEMLSGSGESISQRLSDVATSTPATVALSAISAGIAAKYLRPIDQELRPIFEKFRRITGREISPDIATNNAELQKTMSDMQRIPGLADDVRRVRDSLVAGLTRVVDDIGASAGAARDRLGLAADAVRRLQGSRKELSPITKARRDPQRAALIAAGDTKLPEAVQQRLVGSIARILSDKAMADDRGSAMTSLTKSIKRVAEKGLWDLPNLESLRKRLGNIAFTMSPQDPRFASRGRKEASQIYAAVDEAIESGFPDFSRALRAGEKLRRMEDAMQDVKVSDLDAKTIGRFWSGDKPLQRWEALKRFGTPEDIGAAKGFLFDGLIRYATMADGTINVGRLRRALSSETMFNRQIIDTVMPGVADELLKVGKVYERGKQGILKAEGSPTAGAIARMVNQGLNVTGAAGAIASLFANPYLVIGPALGAAGIRWVVRRHNRSLLEGARANAISRLGQGQLPPPIGRSAAAANAVGGFSGAADTALRSTGAITETAAQGIQSLVGATRGRQEQ